jgi:hypothetical protein
MRAAPVRFAAGPFRPGVAAARLGFDWQVASRGGAHSEEQHERLAPE